jgi:CHAT domain-containing protein/tetratricopeptide (TPR) repeat protein
MMRGVVLCSLFIILVTSLDGTRWAVKAQTAPADEETSLRQLIDRYLDAYNRGSSSDYSALWSETSPFREERTQGFERMHASAKLSYSPARVSRRHISSDRAVFWITTDRRSTRGTGNVTVTSVALSMEFVREQSGWKLWRETSAVAELASALVAAKDEAEREALLSIDPALRSRDLLLLLWGQADRDYQSRDYPRAQAMLRTMLGIAESIGATPDQAMIWRQLAGVAFATSRFGDAVDGYKKAIALEGEDRKYDLAVLWSSLALSHRKLKQRALAIEAFQKSLMLSRASNDTVAVAGTLDSIASLRREEGDYGEAMSGYREAMSIREGLRDRAAVASSLINIAEVEYDQGEDDRALELYQKALSQLQNLSRPELEIHVLHNIASLYYLQGNYDLALTHYTREREISDSISNLQGAAASLAGVALIQTLYGDYVSALDAYETILTIWRQLGSSEEEANTLQKIGRVALAKGDFASAVSHFRSALSVRERIGEPREIAWALLDVGSALAVLREFETAIDTEKRALTLFESIGDRSGIGVSLIHLAGVHFVREDYNSTIELAGRAAAIAREIRDADILWQARYRQGRGYYRLKDYAQARQGFLDAITSIENPQGSSSDNRPQRLLDDKLAPYLGMVDVSINQNLPREAFKFTERARARSLKMLLGANRFRITRDMTAREIATEQQLQKERATVLSQYNREREQGNAQSARLTDLTAQLQKADREPRAFENRLYQTHPLLKTLRGDADPVTLRSVATLIPTSRSAILEFIETDESLYLLVFSSGKPGVPRVDAYTLALTRREAAERAVALQDLIARRQDGWESLARELYDLLIKPAELQLKGKASIVIIPDGWLWNLPFTALQTTEGTFLIESHSISFSSSLTSLKLSSAMQPRVQRTQLLVFGHPELSAAAKERMKVASRDDRFAATEETTSESMRLSELYGASSSRRLISTDARSDRLRDELPGATRVHLAVPAVFNEASPLYSQIALAPSPSIPGDSGVIQLREFLTWKTSADLAVFSSSQFVPRGQSVGRGLTGLSWTLIASNVPALLCGQWKIDGTTEADLMVAFHRELRTSRSTALSWQKTVKTAIRNSERRHPFNWAGYVLLGSGR